ncbi:hypothetical protein F5Y15DRAFT_395034 [Xylariaceae sp. FL0016]|nr:hypothetical protein F5Y15DRAFT_395034 [Xylariaceae sp. FL0016]
MSHPDLPLRPPTPQVLIHRIPDKPCNALDTNLRPSKYIILIMGSTAAAGKLQIAQSIARALSCPLYQGESLHESSAKAASVGGASQSAAGPASHANEARYQRMWLSKLARTGLLFPEESKPATEGFSGFGSASISTSSSRRGSAGSAASTTPPGQDASSSIAGSWSLLSQAPPSTSRPDKKSFSGTTAAGAAFTMSEEERLRRASPFLMVLTHPELEPWHMLAIRTAVGAYGIGVIFIPLYRDDEDKGDREQEDLPILQPLDPAKMTSFPVSSVGSGETKRKHGSLGGEMKLHVHVDADVVSISVEALEGVRAIIQPDG